MLSASLSIATVPLPDHLITTLSRTTTSDHVQFTQKFILGVPLPWSNIKGPLATTSSTSSSGGSPMT